MTIDQMRSRTAPDLVPDMVNLLNGHCADDLLIRFGRTVGDELQGVFRNAAAVATALPLVAEAGQWRVGVGIGGIETVTDEARDARGDAFVRARGAVERAHLRDRTGDVVRTWPVRVDGGDAGQTDPWEYALAMLWRICGSRTDAERDAVRLARTGMTQREISIELGIADSSVSKALDRAGWHVEAAGVVAAHRLIKLEGID